MQKLIKTFSLHGKTLSTCESFTGGLFASKICGIPGASQVYLGSIVAYSVSAKLDLVHIDPKLIQQYGTISPQVVSQMAEKTRLLFKTDYAIAFSGNAGPEAQEGKAVGLWFGAISTASQTIVFGGISNLSRNDLREDAIETGCKNLLELFRNTQG
ncbi:MAG: nicotinamide-nucleotide amidohydrolase family protein [Erysipelotrichaceae bacterium]|nr:nicotinamide-nucleotide amidohydrolase family protein [Erysipelotrichaceae bacterium]